MKSKHVIIAAIVAVSVVGSSGAIVLAATDDSPLACADIISGSGSYTAPAQQKDSLGRNTWITDGGVTFTVELKEATCLNVQYGLVVLDLDPKVDGDGTPTVLASSTVPGDGVSTVIRYEVPVPSDPTQADVCIYLYTTGATGSSSTGKTGAAFDGTSGTQLLDRAPDYPGAYCNYLPDQGGRTYN